MALFTIYEHNVESVVALNSGFVGACMVPADADQTLFLINHNNVTIALNKRISSHVADQDLVVHSWVMDFLNVKPSETLRVESVVLSPASSGCVVDLTFVAYQSRVNWDELPHIGTLHIPYTWSKIWPENYKRSVLERNASMLLHASVLCNGALICMKVLDSLMVNSKHGSLS